MTSKLKLAVGLAIGAALVAGLAGAPAQAQNRKTEYKISTVVGPPFPWGLAAQRWADIVKEKSGGKIAMKVYPGSSLVGGDQTKEFTAMRQGVIDMAVGSTINWSPQVQELNLFSMPFLMPDYKAIDALTQGEVGKKLFEIIGAKDVVPLAWGETGFRELWSQMLELVASDGNALDDEELTESDVILPPRDITFAEAKGEFSGDGLIPD